MEESTYITCGKSIYSKLTLKLSYKEFDDFKCGFSDELNEYFKIILIPKGSGSISINEKNILYTAPVLFCINEKEKFNYTKSNSSDILKVVFFHPRIINSRFNFENTRTKEELSGTDKQDLLLLTPFLSREKNFSEAINIGPTSLLRVIERFNSLQNELSVQPDEYWPCRSRSYFLEILFFIEKLFSKHGESEIKSSDGNESFNKILCYLHENYSKKITVADIAKAFASNKTSLEKLFRENLNTSILSYLIDIRINMALILLKDTEIPVSEILFRVGYNDAANFIKAFKKKTGFTPTEYREKFNFYKYKD